MRYSGALVLFFIPPILAISESFASGKVDG